MRTSRCGPWPSSSHRRPSWYRECTSWGSRGTRTKQESADALEGVIRKTYESVITPVDTLALVGVGVGVTLDLTGLSAPKSVKVGSSSMC
jgi:hypothetical protein